MNYRNSGEQETFFIHRLINQLEAIVKQLTRNIGTAKMMT